VVNVKEQDSGIILKLINGLFFIAIIMGLGDFFFLKHLPNTIGLGNIIGVSLFVLGVFLYILAKSALGDQFSNILTMADNLRLITYGIYSYIRHPYYLGGILIGVGIQLSLSSILGLTVMFFPIMLVMWLIPIEERMLIESFGEEYIEYMKRTKKILPFLY